MDGSPAGHAGRSLGPYRLRRKSWMTSAIEIRGDDIDADCPGGRFPLKKEPAAEVDEYIRERVAPGDEARLELLFSTAFGEAKAFYGIRHRSRLIGATTEAFGSQLHRILRRNGRFSGRLPASIDGLRVEAIDTVAGTVGTAREVGLGDVDLWHRARVSGLGRLDGTRNGAVMVEPSGFDDYYDLRRRLVDRLLGDLVGPEGARDEVINERPMDKYPMGALYPQQSGTLDSDQDNGVETETGEGEADPPVALANVHYPSSMGLTFAVDLRSTSSVLVTTSAARYEPEGEAQGGEGSQEDPLPASRIGHRATFCSCQSQLSGTSAGVAGWA